MIILSRCSSWRLFSYILFWFYLSITVSPYSWNQLQCRWDAWRVKNVATKRKVIEDVIRNILTLGPTLVVADYCAFYVYQCNDLGLLKFPNEDATGNNVLNQETRDIILQSAIFMQLQLYSVELWGPCIDASHFWRKCCRYFLFRLEIGNSTLQSLKCN